MENKAVCVIVPDVHGRIFWKDIFEFDCNIVFLGDYVDPYDFEKISKNKAIENFKEILDYAKSHDNVELLLGNHDCEYFIGTDICECRCDYKNFDTIRDLFLENSDRFSFAVKKNFAGKDFLLSHAGVHPFWLKNHSALDIDFICNVKKDDSAVGLSDFDKFSSALADVSSYRGGWSPAGSVVWSDIREYIKNDRYDIDWSKEKYEQICGHTYLKDQAIRTGKITCVDLRKIIVVNENGELCNKDFSPLEIFEL